MIEQMNKRQIKNNTYVFLTSCRLTEILKKNKINDHESQSACTLLTVPKYRHKTQVTMMIYSKIERDSIYDLRHVIFRGKQMNRDSVLPTRLLQSD